jgi:Bacterial Ig-like domain (group 2)
MLRNQLTRLVFGSVVVLLCTGCGGGGPKNMAPVLASISITPNTKTISPGSSHQFTATGTFSDGSTQNLSSTATWSSSHPHAATITASGLVKGLGDGTTNISAASSGLTASIMVIVQSGTPDPLGSVSAASDTCSGVVSGTNCYSMTVSCPGVASAHALAKVTAPAGTPKGTVLFIGGGGATGYYEGYTFGASIVTSVVHAGYTGVQVSFPDLSLGWLTGPGGTRKLACLPATVARWIFDNVHQSGALAPLCVHGESGGASVIAYSLSHYGMAAFFSMVEPAGGPPFARIDNGCLCNQPSVTGPCSANLIPQCYETDVQAFVDTTYNAPLCTQAAAGDITNAALFLHDSILSGPDAQLSFPNTDVHQLFGDADLTAAVPEGYQWSQAITSKRATECVIGSGHSMPNFASAATKIVDDLVAGCHLQ